MPRHHLRRLAKNEQGSVSLLAAIAIVPILLTIGLLADSGMAWLSRNNGVAGVDAAAALVAMHRPACNDGDDLSSNDAILHAAQAAFVAAAGQSPDELTIKCTATGASVTARIPSPVSVFSFFSKPTINIAAAEAANQQKFAGNMAAGWSK